MKKNKIVSIVLSVGLIVGGLSYLVVSSFGETMIYYKTVDEVLAEPARYSKRPIRVNGTLVTGSTKHKPGTDEYRFQLAKQGKVLDVAYTGIIPDTMLAGRELVVQGKIQSDRNFFVATQILTKCPSKHEAQAKSMEE